MNHRFTGSCNCCECIWKRINANSGIILQTITGKQVSYQVQNDIVIWQNIEPSHNTLYPQSKTQICQCIESRIQHTKPSDYPGTAKSYKWALLNNPTIWL